MFDCVICNHEFIISLYSISLGSWCQFCGKQELCSNECDFCFNKSFASHEKSKYWSNKNKLNPRKVFKSSGKSYLFNCNKCKREFKSIVRNVSNGSWCPYCKNKTESKLYDYLKSIYQNTVHQFKASWCKKKTHLPFDFCIPNHKIIIELDGGQHFKQISNWQSPEDTQDNDKFKMNKANENGYKMIRLLQTDVFSDTYDWQNELTDNILQLIDNKYQNIFMCKNNEYEEFNKK
jgi:very-short-patch-repair endonuclease